ncbi:SOS response-associated peptidase [Clostridium sp. OS1-26]|uniref:SOS response-associated peptidase n=1 Tax=Clostridium sp. OS1-26 TaxID=3070681 RepID=UPI0027E1DCEA|nr:SOS response-associated peptidase [Clostridium sp. OS1-26]WML33452.1 SOS response-associated peptidase [Clostridium sp. OS1-26]
MCGRFYIENDIEDIMVRYGIKNTKNITYSKGEIFPGTNIPIIFNNEERKLDFFRWGYQIRGLNKEIINARIETVAEKQNFRKAFLNNRCIIPANAFFEWHNREKGKDKYKISLKDIKLFSMAGIYDNFIDKNNNPYFGVVILTRAANEHMSKVHNRMPVFIKKEEEEEWLLESPNNALKLKEKLENSNCFNLNITPVDGSKQLSMYDLI